MADPKEIIKKINDGSLTYEEQLALLSQVEQTIKEQKQKKEEQLQLKSDYIIQAFNKIKNDLEQRINEIEVKEPIQGPKGDKGDKGERGADGYQGRDGRDGKDGINGVDGVDGVGVADAHIDFDGTLVITLTNGKEITAGDVVPLDIAEKLQVFYTNPASSGGATGTIASQDANNVAITGGAIDGVTIGATTPAAVTGTTITATTFAGGGVSNWNTAYGWGNHASAGYAVLSTAQTFTAAQRGGVTALTDGATITPDFAAANNYSVTLGGNRTLANPTNLVAGQSGVIKITQDGTGSRTLAFGSYWKFPNGTAPTLTTTASAVDVLAYYVDSSTTITARLISDRK